MENVKSNLRRIGLLAYDNMCALDLVGPAEAFASAIITDGIGTARPAYEVLTLGLSRKPVVCESGLVLHPTRSLRSVRELDTLLIPGGRGLRTPRIKAQVTAWVSQHAARIRRIATVCTGIYGLAPTGLLDGRMVTTHWKFARDVAQQFPKLRVDPDALYLKDGKFYTSAGVTAGIDLTLALIEEDLGTRAAMSVARELVVYLKRPGGQAQYSEPLQFQVEATDRFADLAAWMPAHLQEDLSIEAMAHRTSLCPRHFSRQFKSVFGTSPAAFVEELRLNEARRRIESASSSMEVISRSVGFSSSDAFRRAFQRRFGVAPSSYRSRFEVRPCTTSSPATKHALVGE